MNKKFNLNEPTQCVANLRSLRVPFVALPCWIEEEIKIVHAPAILHHVARKANLAGDTSEEKATIEMI